MKDLLSASFDVLMAFLLSQLLKERLRDDTKRFVYALCVVAIAYNLFLGILNARDLPDKPKQ